jgi:hypothetical protein
MHDRSAIGRCSRLAPIFCGWPASGLIAAAIQLCGTVHDAVVIESAVDCIDADVALMQEIMRRAARAVLGGHELRTDATIVRYPGRYSDRRGEKIWQDVLGLLAQYRQQQEAAHA